MIQNLIHINLFFKSKKGLWIGFFIILFSISLLYCHFSKTINTHPLQSREDASGFDYQYAKKFLYFFYYGGHFPLATLRENIIDSKKGADYEMHNHGRDLIMEYKHWSRLGEHARIFAFLPDAWKQQSTAIPSLTLFNTLFFCIGLLSLFYGTWKIGHPLYGLLTCVLVCSTPYYQYEIFQNQNIFGLLHSAFFFMIGLNLPLLFNPSISFMKALGFGIISVIFIAFCSEVRNEISIVFGVLVLLFVVVNSLSWIQKVVCILLLFISFGSVKKGIQYGFDKKFKETAILVHQLGGHVYTGGRIQGHQIWHNVFCGLGDFDQKYGFQWDDRMAYQHALPILKEQYGIDVAYSGGYQTDLFYDSAKLYYIKFDEILPYERIMKNEMINAIKRDPLWYLNILRQRIWIILKTTLPFPNAGWLIFPLCIFLVYKKEWIYFKLIVCCLPLSMVSLLIYSGRGATYNSIYPLAVLVIGFAMLIKYGSLFKMRDAKNHTNA